MSKTFKKFTPAEKNFIQQHWETMHYVAIADKVNHTPDAVYKKAYNMGLKCNGLNHRQGRMKPITVVSEQLRQLRECEKKHGKKHNSNPTFNKVPLRVNHKTVIYINPNLSVTERESLIKQYSKAV